MKAGFAGSARERNFLDISHRHAAKFYRRADIQALHGFVDIGLYNVFLLKELGAAENDDADNADDDRADYKQTDLKVTYIFHRSRRSESRF